MKNAKAKHASAHAAENGVSFACALAPLATELLQSAKLGAELQWALSGLLEGTASSGSAEEMRMLQNLDRMQQVFADLARYSDALVRLAPAGPLLDRDMLLADVQLPSVRQKLLPATGTADEPRDSTDDDVTWF